MTRNGTHPGETRKWKLMKMLADVDEHSVWSECEEVRELKIIFVENPS